MCEVCAGASPLVLYLLARFKIGLGRGGLPRLINGIAVWIIDTPLKCPVFLAHLLAFDFNQEEQRENDDNSLELATP